MPFIVLKILNKNTLNIKVLKVYINNVELKPAVRKALNFLILNNIIFPNTNNSVIKIKIILHIWIPLLLTSPIPKNKSIVNINKITKEKQRIIFFLSFII